MDRLKVATVKLDRSPNLGLWYGIRCIPTMLYFVDGEVSIGIFGTTSKEAILSQLKPVISSRRAPELNAASLNGG
jgi:thioredoxin-like negative regulator of GroEL